MSQQFYETYWSSEGQGTVGSTWSQLRDLLASSLPRGGRVLDVGCGDGLTTGGLIRRVGRSHVGVDVASTALRNARRRGIEVVQVRSADELPFPDSAFDAAVCIDVLEHLFDPEGATMEVRRVLSAGAPFIVTTPNIAYWRSRVKLAAGLFDPLGDPTVSKHVPWRDPHIRFFTAASLRRMLTMAGFADVQVAGHQGSLAANLPYLRKWQRSLEGGRLYQKLEGRFPGALGFRLAAVAR